MCYTAKNITKSKDSRDSEEMDSPWSSSPQCLWITYADFTGIYREAIQCATDPQLTLRIRDSEEQMIIMIVEGKILKLFC